MSKSESVNDIDRRTFFKGSAVGAAGLATLGGACIPEEKQISDTSDFSSFELEEFTIGQLQDQMTSGQISSKEIIELYLGRIDAIDRQGPTLHSILETNPEALSIAESLDQERKQKGVRSPLHGIPIVLKDNIDTHDKMTTTAGSLAL